MSQLAHILTVSDGVIIRVYPDVSLDITDTITGTSPYRSEDDFGNPLAKTLRLRDLVLSRGEAVQFDPVVVPADHDMSYYVFKKFVNGNVVDNPDIPEQERAIKACLWLTDQPLPIGQDSRALMKVTAAEVQDYMTAEEFNSVLNRLREPYENAALFSEQETAKYVAMFNQMPADLSIKMRLKFAAGADWRCFWTASNPIVHDSADMCQVAFYWWDLLKGTFLESFAMSKKAILYFRLGQYDKYLETYSNLLLNDLPTNIRQMVESNIYYMSGGQLGLLKTVNDTFNAGQYRTAFNYAQQWLATSYGVLRLKNEAAVIDIKKQSIAQFLGQ